MNKDKILHTVQETSSTSLGPFLVSSSYGAVSATCAVRSCLSASSCPAAAVLVVWCRCRSPSPSLSSPCGGCPRCPSLSSLSVVVLVVHRCPRCPSSSCGGPHRRCCCRLSPRYRCRCHPVPLFLLSWLRFFFVVAPSPSSPCQLPVSTPRAAARSGGMGVGVPSWRRLVVNNIDKT